MVSLPQSKKNRIILSDYPYRRDIENRVLMSRFSVNDVKVLEEILEGSLTIAIAQLSKNLNLKVPELMPILQKLSLTRLFTIKDEHLLIDKEMRKYYESQLPKFSEDFETGMEFLKGLLRKVPIDVLPTWYALPRTTDDIFQSLVEKYLLTPKIFQRYLHEWGAENPFLLQIAQEIFQSPNLKVYSDYLIDKYGLSREAFEETMLLLEFSFVCCLRYTQVGDEWKEIVTPFYEWQEYLLFLKKNQITSSNAIAIDKASSFDFLKHFELLIKSIGPEGKALVKLEAELADLEESLPSHLKMQSDIRAPKYPKQLIDKLLLLKIGYVLDGVLYLYPEVTSQWFDLSQENQALQFYRYCQNKFYQYEVDKTLCNEKNIREIEKSIYSLAKQGWVKFNDFFQALIAPIGSAAEVALKKMGRQWRYSLPQFSAEEKLFVKAVIFERLWEMGMVKVVNHEGEDYFCLTHFGNKILT